MRDRRTVGSAIRHDASGNKDSVIRSELVTRGMDGCMERHTQKEGHGGNIRGQGASVEVDLVAATRADTLAAKRRKTSSEIVPGDITKVYLTEAARHGGAHKTIEDGIIGSGETTVEG